MALPAQAHDWFTNRVDPITSHRCCGGSDCNTIPALWLENGAITETPDGYAVNLTAKEANEINAALQMPIKDFVPWSRVQMSSDDGSVAKIAMRKSGFAMCIWSGKVQCFFRPPGNS